MWLSQAIHGSCEAEPTPKAPSMGQQQRATFVQVVVFILLVTDGIWSHRELSTKLDSLALLSAPLLLGPLALPIQETNMQIPVDFPILCYILEKAV